MRTLSAGAGDSDTTTNVDIYKIRLILKRYYVQFDKIIVCD